LTFSRKSLKTIRREIDKLYEQNLTIRSDDNNDFEEMVILNIERFGTQSYFANNQFVKSFRSLKDYLAQKGWLKMTAVLIGGRIAAVDMGCIYNGNYKLLAGGTHSDFPGVAKAINLHHMEEACKNSYNEVDFLCGDFSWKKIFHLSPRPLYQLSDKNVSVV
jgi:CelD/BcsL family acetyltransferase involved in cellulose biosynthesis